MKQEHISSKQDENVSKCIERREWEQVITKKPIQPPKIQYTRKERKVK